MFDFEDVLDEHVEGEWRWQLVPDRYPNPPIEECMNNWINVHVVGDPAFNERFGNGGVMGDLLALRESRIGDCCDGVDDMARKLMKTANRHGWYGLIARSEEGNTYLITENPQATGGTRRTSEDWETSMAKDWIAWCNGETYAIRQQRRDIWVNARTGERRGEWETTDYMGGAFYGIPAHGEFTVDTMETMPIIEPVPAEA